MKYLYLGLMILSVALTSSCMKGERVDLVIHNAQIHSMDEQSTVYEAVAIRDGIIVEVGPERQILNKYSAEEYIDAQQKDVYPGFTDAHGHMLSYAKRKLMVDLVGCKSYDEMLVRLEKFQSKYEPEVIIGFGWDQSLWGEKNLPTNDKLNEVFPNIPVYLTRIDGHSSLVNNKLLQLAHVEEQLEKLNNKIENGHVAVESGKLTGLLIDGARDLVEGQLPEHSMENVMAMMKEIQQELFSYGITGVHEAGIDPDDLKMLESMVDNGELKLNIYGMLYPYQENIEFAKKNGIYENKNLLIRSFKVVGDGALGSRGACLKEEYSDQHGHFGHLTTSIEELNSIALLCEEIGYQMNTHAIGDSTNKLLLDIHEELYCRTPDHRWRIEHAQVVDVDDIPKFMSAGTFPSVQPTHAISDQRWAKDRIGEDRLKGAYAYQSILQQFGMMAIGTDFPIEVVNPFRTIHAAVNRTTLNNDPAGGFLKEEGLTLEQCLRGMTQWAAFASFQENELGTIEKGKDATLVIFESPIDGNPVFKQNFANTTFIKGKRVYSVE